MTVKTDVVAEYTSGSGVTIDGVLLKDGLVDGVDVGAPFAGLLATGATVGATAQAQAFTSGIVGPSWKPAIDSTDALQLQTAAGANVLNVNTVDARVGINTSAPAASLHVVGNYLRLNNGFKFSTDSSSNAELSSPGDLYFYTATAIGSNPMGVALLNLVGGAVGIGTYSPATRLDIDAGALTMKEMTAPTGVADKAMLYTKDNGSGKTQLCVKLGDDVEVVLATQA